MKIHPAPWGRTLKLVSLLLVALAVAIPLISHLCLPPGIPPLAAASVWILPVVVIGCLPFMISGYQITDGAILIRRPFWTTRLDRAGLESAEVVPLAMKGSLRTCGNGGGFSFTGWYWSKSLGSYRAFVNDLNRTVVLRFKKRTVVVSPEDPEEFVKELAS